MQLCIVYLSSTTKKTEIHLLIHIRVCLSLFPRRSSNPLILENGVIQNKAMLEMSPKITLRA
jgi:hypothetical protein